MNRLPNVTKNLLAINILMFLATIVMQRQGTDLTGIFGLHFFAASDFAPYQLVTYMFMHGDFSHLFFNMFALYMFGGLLERVWGSKRFLIYYIVCGVGAGLLQEAVQYITYVQKGWNDMQLIPTLYGYIPVGDEAVEDTTTEDGEPVIGGDASTDEGTQETGTLTFKAELPDGVSGSVSVKMIKIENGNEVSEVYNETVDEEDFPVRIPVTGKGNAEVQLYINESYAWSQYVNFSEGGN